jgi:RNA polymerase sigma factor (sigma-70 family)
MQAALGETLSTARQDREIAATVRRERGRLLAFIRHRVADAAEAEDILQETLYELVLAYRMTRPVEQAGAWLARVARNRIIDRFRRARPMPLASAAHADSAGGGGDSLEDLLPAAEAGPEAEVIRAVLLGEIETALADLPAEQREVFVAQELNGASFRELSERSGVSINTLLSRKRYAVQFLRRRLRAAWDDWLMT